MFKDLFSTSVLLDLPVVSMLGFFAVFVGVCIWVSSRKREAHYDRMSQLPLDEDRGGSR